MSNIEDYKGIFYNDTETKQYYEGGAHFSYKALYQQLFILKQQVNPCETFAKSVPKKKIPIIRNRNHERDKDSNLSSNVHLKVNSLNINTGNSVLPKIEGYYTGRNRNTKVAPKKIDESVSRNFLMKYKNNRNNNPTRKFMSIDESQIKKFLIPLTERKKNNAKLRLGEFKPNINKTINKKRINIKYSMY